MRTLRDILRRLSATLSGVYPTTPLQAHLEERDAARGFW